MIRKVRNCCKTCENLVCIATTIDQLQHSEYLKPMFLNTFKWAIRPVFPETVTIIGASLLSIATNLSSVDRLHNVDGLDSVDRDSADRLVAIGSIDRLVTIDILDSVDR